VAEEYSRKDYGSYHQLSLIVIHLTAPKHSR